MSRISRLCFTSIITVVFTYITFIPSLAIAVPAESSFFDYTEPDGSSFKMAKKGDEWKNWVENQYRYPIAQGADGFWYYVDTSASGAFGGGPLASHLSQGTMSQGFSLSTVRASQPPPAGLLRNIPPSKPGAQPPASVPRPGPAGVAPYGAYAGKLIIILVSFTDRAGTVLPTTFANRLSAAGGINAYYNNVSHGAATISPANESHGTVNDGVIGWLNISATLAALEIIQGTPDTSGNHPNTGGNTGVYNQLITKAALINADPFINYAAYDTNGNGTIENHELGVLIIVAGSEASYGPVQFQSVWGHAWSINPDPNVVGLPVLDGKALKEYCQIGEYHDTHDSSVGIMVHELGHHIFQWIDLYDYDPGIPGDPGCYTLSCYQSEGVGPWSVMSYGSWGAKMTDNWAGQTPVGPDAWHKLFSGWVTPITDTGPVSLTASTGAGASSANTTAQYRSGTLNEFFLVENRQNTGWDQGLQIYLGALWTGGIAIWHVDENITAFAANADDLHRKVHLEGANGSDGDAEGSLKTYFTAAALYKAGGATTFDTLSIPDSKAYSGIPSELAITMISAAGSPMSMTVSAAAAIDGDMDGDGKGDIFWRNFSHGGNAIWHMDGANWGITGIATYLSGAGVRTLNTAWTMGGIGDFDGDGQNDLLWRNSVSGANAI
ncbi:MAG: M6 family metalloprotease domain-containing protein, partial [Nitrospinota bacterium]|nr:M6 family metalloprotease domain-containing protein [Nitrospinota bacterium]